MYKKQTKCLSLLLAVMMLINIFAPMGRAEEVEGEANQAAFSDVNSKEDEETQAEDNLSENLDPESEESLDNTSSYSSASDSTDSTSFSGTDEQRNEDDNSVSDSLSSSSQEPMADSLDDSASNNVVVPSADGLDDGNSVELDNAQEGVQQNSEELVQNSLSGGTYSSAGVDISDNLDVDITIEDANGNIIDDGDEIEYDENTEKIELTIKGTFPIPTISDFNGGSSTYYVQLGDWATKLLSTSEYVSITTTFPVPIVVNGQPGNIMGYINSFVDDDGETYVTITFDSDDEDKIASISRNLTNGRNITSGFEFTVEIDIKSWTKGSGSNPITVLGKEINLQKQPVEYDIEKTGELVDEDKNIGTAYVEWTVDLSSSGYEATLNGGSFSDDLSDVGEFIDGSLEVYINGSDTPITLSSSSSDYEYTNNILSFDFDNVSQDNITSAVVKFKTKIPADKYYANSSEIENTAGYTPEDADDPIEDSDEITITNTWIKKYVDSINQFDQDDKYLYKNRTVDWSVLVNPEGYTLNSVVVTETLETGWELDTSSVTAWKYTGTETTADKISASWNSFYNDGEYDGNSEWEIITPVNTTETSTGSNIYEISLGNISSAVVVSLTTEIPDYDDTNGPQLGTLEYTNTASVTWYDNDKNPEGSATASVGIPTISKYGVVTDYQNALIDWSVSVNTMKQDALVNSTLYVYDIFYYGDISNLDPTNFILGGLSKSGNSFNDTDFSGNYKSDAESIVSDKNYYSAAYQKFYSLTSGQAYAVYEIEDGSGNVVGELLVVQGITNDSSQTITFKTQITNPNIYASNVTTQMDNTAILGIYGTSYDTKLTAYNKVKYTSEILMKVGMVAGFEGISEANATTEASKIFDYTTGEAVFCLGVNLKSVNLSEIWENQKFVVVDTLPEDWEFVTDDSGKPIYTVYNSNLQQITGTDLEDLLESVEIGTDGSGKATLTFTFKELNDKYFILVSAKPTDNKLNDYFLENNDAWVSTNQVVLTTEDENEYDWNPQDEQNVSIISEVITKDVDEYDSSTHFISWVIKYDPYAEWITEDITQAYMVDELSDDLYLTYDADGNLILGENGLNLVFTEAELQPDGSLVEKSGGTVISAANGDDMSQYVKYDAEKHTLTITIPDSETPYIISYQTKVATTSNGVTVSNTVTLYGRGEGEAKDQAEHVIKEASAWAEMLDTTGFYIIKKDANGERLEGIVFNLTNSRGTVIQSKKTDENGIAFFDTLAAGTYYLTETVQDDYLDDPRVYKVVVTEDEETGELSTTIDGDDVSYIGGVYLTITNYDASEYGQLKITKKLVNSSTNRSFNMDIIFTGEDDAPIANTKFTYVSTNEPNILQTFTTDDDGKATVPLKGGETITIQGITLGTKYAVTEQSSSSSGFSVSYTNQEGIVSADGEGEKVVTEVIVTNTLPSGTVDPSDPDDPDNPSSSEDPDSSDPSSTTSVDNGKTDDPSSSGDSDDPSNSNNNGKNGNSGNSGSSSGSGKNGKSSSAKTGDYVPIVALIAMAVACAVCIAFMLKKRSMLTSDRKKK